MTSWRKEEIEIADGTKVLAQMPVIVSASRSTDIPAFYSDWFMERLEAGYVTWFNPFNGVPLYVGKGGVNAREFTPDEMCAVAQRIGCADAGHVFDTERRKVVQTFRPRFHSPRRFDILLPAMLRQSFTDFIFATSTDGSGNAASYVRALDMFGPILAKHYPKPIVGGSVWHGFSLADIHAVLTRVPWGHRMLIIDKCHSQPEKALFYVRRTIQNGWSRDVLRRRRNAIRRDSVQVEERQGGRMADYTLILCGDSTGFLLAKLARPLSVLIRQILFICSEKFYDHLAVGC